MIKQKLYIIDFEILFNILDEIKNILSFQIFNYNNLDIFLKLLNSDQVNLDSCLIVTKNQNKNIFKDKIIDNKSLFFLDDLPIELNKIIEKINVHLIKKKYNYQSKIDLKEYTINLNSRIISQNKKNLKLTEKEINIILFLSKNEKPQSINKLQNEVWGYSSGLETHTVETHIYRLRKKIKYTFSDNKFILSHNDGYLIK
jgi:hypothetical protein